MAVSVVKRSVPKRDETATVGYSTCIVTAGQTDLFAEALFMLTLFVLVVLLGQLRNLPLCCPFRVSW